MIQIINYKKKYSNDMGNNIIISSLSEPKSLDEFEINIIDLQSSALWYNNDNTNTSINNISDFINLATMISECRKSKIIIAFPSNFNFLYHRDFSDNKYYNSIELKNMLNKLNLEILIKLLNRNDYSLVYEPTETIINGEKVPASFYFLRASNILTKSNKSEKSTTILLDKLYLTTLDVFSSVQMVFDYLREIHLIEDKEAIPEWIKDYNAFDDEQEKEEIYNNSQIISECSSKIESAQNKLDENNRYKSILYTQSDELVVTVFEIIEKLLNCNLSDFVDEKKEDFLIKQQNITFIGEIKGVNSNVKLQNVSQLEVHYQGYMEDRAESNEKVKALLIINHQRTRPLNEREPVHESQIHLAERNESLIIETCILLKLFEKFQTKEITFQECIDLLKLRTGILMESDF